MLGCCYKQTQLWKLLWKRWKMWSSFCRIFMYIQQIIFVFCWSGTLRLLLDNELFLLFLPPLLPWQKLAPSDSSIGPTTSHLVLHGLEGFFSKSAFGSLHNTNCLSWALLHSTHFSCQLFGKIAVYLMGSHPVYECNWLWTHYMNSLSITSPGPHSQQSEYTDTDVTPISMQWPHGYSLW